MFVESLLIVGWIMDNTEKLKQDIKFLLSFAPKNEPPEGLDPTFYNTLTYKGDLSLWERIENIRESING